MKRITPAILMISFFLITVISTFSRAQSASHSEQMPFSIFQGKKMLNGTPLIADSSIDLHLLQREYEREKPLWDKALAFLNLTRLDTLAPGKYTVDGDLVYALVTENTLKTPETAKWESHRKYIDLQCVIRGAELIQVSSLARASVSSAYDEKKDLAGYEASGSSHLAGPGRIFVFFSQDVHKPNLQAGTATKDKKIVLKIRASEFQ